MGKLTLSSEIERLKAIPDFQGTHWSSIKPEFAARMAIQNQFKTGIDVAKYTASIMRKDMEAYVLNGSLMNEYEKPYTGQPFKINQ